MKKITFGTDGWRGIMCDDFIFQNVRIVACSIADYLKAEGKADKGLVIGYDSRFLSENFAKEVASICNGKGIHVFLTQEDTPTPVTAYAVHYLKTAGAVMITASHNPPAYNGIKFIPEYAGPAMPDITGKIEQFIAKNSQIEQFDKLEEKEALAKGFLEYIEPFPYYQEQLAKLIDFDLINQAQLKMVIDPMYASGRKYLEKVFGACEEKPKIIHNQRDTLFGGTMPEPKIEFLGELINLVKEGHCHLGLATDGDADRFGIIDEKGNYLTPNEVIALTLLHLLENKKIKGPVARSLATTHLLDRISNCFGVDVYETPVGFKYIGELMRTEGAIIGGEESGGLSIYGHIPEKDGILACCLMAELVAFTKKPLSELVAEMMAKYGATYTKRIDIHCNDQEKNTALNFFKSGTISEIEGKQVLNTSYLDGIKFYLTDNCWMLVRPSGTEGLIRIYLETGTPEDLSALQTAAWELFEKAVKQLV